MSARRVLYLATANAHKVREMMALLADCGWEVRPAPAGVADVAENGATFAENARVKALAVAAAVGGVALADDSGLVVDALDGAPGVRSRRWAGENATDADRIACLLDAMAGVDEPGRNARFVCSVCIAGPAGVLFEGSGSVEGRIARTPRGSNGFGYDPVFLVEDGAETMAELDENRKNAVSHRGRAMRLAAEWLRVQSAAAIQ
jgi:XTP/dITP diphosphohydrolase